MTRYEHFDCHQKKQGSISGTIGTLSVMIARRRHQSQAPQISTVTSSMIKLPGTVGPTATLSLHWLVE
jgi:hypothetical protein